MMDKQTYLAMRSKIVSQIKSLQQQEEELKAQYLSQFPQVGDLVLYKDDRYHICNVRSYSDGDMTFDLRKPKKDGTPSNGGRIEYYVKLDEIQPIETVTKRMGIQAPSFRTAF